MHAGLCFSSFTLCLPQIVLFAFAVCVCSVIYRVIFVCVSGSECVSACGKWACEWVQPSHRNGAYVCAFNNLLKAFTGERGAHSYFSTLLLAHSFATWSSFATLIANKVFFELISQTNFRLCFSAQRMPPSSKKEHGMPDFTVYSHSALYI